MSIDCSLGQYKNHLEHTHHNHDTVEPNEKRQKIAKKSYTEMMKYFQPLASLVAKHPQQIMYIGALEGLYSLFEREGTSDKTTIQGCYQNFLYQFSTNHNCGFLKNLQTEEQSVSTFRRKVTVGKPRKDRMTSATEMNQTNPVGTGSGRRCHFCNDKVSHSTRSTCSNYK